MRTLRTGQVKTHEALKNTLLGDDAAADSDGASLEQAKIKHARLWSTLVGWTASHVGEQVMSQSQGDTIQQMELSSSG